MQFGAAVDRNVATHNIDHRWRAAHVDRRFFVHAVQQVGRGGQAVFVVGAHRHLVAECEQLIQERQAVPVAAGVAQRPWDAAPLGEAGHRQDRGDADAARDERSFSVRDPDPGNGIMKAFRGALISTVCPTARPCTSTDPPPPSGISRTAT